MKILITVPRLTMPGGVANYYRTLRSHLDGDKVYVEIGRAPGERHWWQKACRLLGDYWRFDRQLARGGFDLVQVNPSLDLHAIIRDAAFILIAKSRGFPVLVFFHGWRTTVEELVRSRFPRLFRNTYGKADGYIILAEEFRRSLLTLGIRGPFFLQTPPVDDSAFSAGIDRQKPGDDGSCHILFLSRLDTGKGLSAALATFAVLQARYPAACMSIAGDGTERVAAEKEVADRGLKQVRFLGYVTGAEKTRAFADADIYLFTSMSEGMPTSVLEAMASGLPVVTRPVGGIRDFFEDGHMGFAVDSEDPADFADRLARLIEDRGMRQRIGRYNRDYARSHFSASQVTARLLAIYDQIVRSSDSA
ncbi:MAG: glycosyltransferase family 4 protein [Gammaproteobacteria bacterium]|nr:glycosyltransferase family 4 protein [Gammaproteobacteria bacterium]